MSDAGLETFEEFWAWLAFWGSTRTDEPAEAESCLSA